jgi:hypothetical protein
MMSDLRTSGRWLRFARVLWAVLALVLVIVAIIGTGGGSGLCAPEGPICTEEEVAAVLAEMGISLPLAAGLIFVLHDIWVPFISLVVSGLLFWIKRDSWLALTAVVAMVMYAVYINTDTLEQGYLVIMGQPMPLLVNAVLNAITLAAIVGLVLTFPDGRFVPAWSWPLVIFGIVVFFAGIGLGLPGVITDGPLNLTLLLGLMGQIYRYRYLSTPVTRQQSRWVLLGLVAWVANVFVWLLLLAPAFERGAEGLPALLIGVPINALLVTLLPVTLAIAILRYRLWDIDVVIRKTLVYALLTALLALVYLGSVLLMQTLFGRLAGEQSPLIIVISTVLIAALFAPSRRRLQAVIDRRFFRGKYDAQQVLARFAVAARDETDLAALSAELVKVVGETMRPESVTLWLKRP